MDYNNIYVIVPKFTKLSFVSVTLPIKCLIVTPNTHQQTAGVFFFRVYIVPGNDNIILTMIRHVREFCTLDACQHYELLPFTVLSLYCLTAVRL